MPFVLDVHLHEGGRHVASSKHFSADDDQPLDNVIRDVLMERALSLETIQQNSGLSSADVALGLASRIKSVASAGGTRADLTKFLQEQKVPLKMLGSVRLYSHPETRYKRVSISSTDGAFHKQGADSIYQR